MWLFRHSPVEKARVVYKEIIRLRFGGCDAHPTNALTFGVDLIFSPAVKGVS
jgi:hypothetical protein